MFFVTIIELIKVVLINVITILIMSAKSATPGLSKSSTTTKLYLVTMTSTTKLYLVPQIILRMGSCEESLVALA